MSAVDASADVATRSAASITAAPDIDAADIRARLEEDLEDGIVAPPTEVQTESANQRWTNLLTVPDATGDAFDNRGDISQTVLEIDSAPRLYFYNYV
ncbi:MAG TPA: hypothetical protein VL916_00705, partial [Ilumatobacteraceae bacterium]|nr:hypothetical protein [Ilumatobacteraceae bacterium]